MHASAPMYMSSQRERSQIPFNEHNLTMMLRPALLGRSLLSVLLNVPSTPVNGQFLLIQRTLEFGKRISQITKANVNDFDRLGQLVPNPMEVDRSAEDAGPVAEEEAVDVDRAVRVLARDPKRRLEDLAAKLPKVRTASLLSLSRDLGPIDLWMTVGRS